MAKLKVAVNISRKWVIGIGFGFSLTLGTGMAAIQPNGFFYYLVPLNSIGVNGS